MKKKVAILALLCSEPLIVMIEGNNNTAVYRANNSECVKCKINGAANRPAMHRQFSLWLYVLSSTWGPSIAAGWFIWSAAADISGWDPVCMYNVSRKTLTFNDQKWRSQCTTQNFGEDQLYTTLYYTPYICVRPFVNLCCGVSPSIVWLDKMQASEIEWRVLTIVSGDCCCGISLHG